MKHLGDITKISGYAAPIVDCIIGGSPCQDLSMAGKRAGLDGERSGLYIKQVRIVKEMRERDERNGRSGVDIRPRYMVWENVPGAFSSNKGEGFRIVLEELAKIKDPNAVIPMPEKWTNHGCILGDGWSIAWRVLDEQFWGVPQRRRRIALVADFGGQSAPEILFVRKSVSGYIEPSEPKRKTASADVTRGIGTDDPKYISCNQGGIAIVESVPHLMDAYQHHGWRQSDTCGTLTVGQNNTVRGDTPLVLYCIQGNMIGRSDKNGPQGDEVNEDVSFTLNTTDRHAVACYRQGGYADYVEGEVGTLRASGGDYGGGTENLLVEQNTRYIVRRLSPLECERLQGYPDGWTDIGEWVDSKGKKRQTSDAARYKALGNSIALPPWKWVLKKLCACYERDATMASLFDGIGGFPYLWEQLNGKGSCLWASEIEEFPIAVTKARIGE